MQNTQAVGCGVKVPLGQAVGEWSPDDPVRYTACLRDARVEQHRCLALQRKPSSPSSFICRESMSGQAKARQCRAGDEGRVLRVSLAACHNGMVCCTLHSTGELLTTRTSCQTVCSLLWNSIHGCMLPQPFSSRKCAVPAHAPCRPAMRKLAPYSVKGFLGQAAQGAINRSALIIYIRCQTSDITGRSGAQQQPAHKPPFQPIHVHPDNEEFGWLSPNRMQGSYLSHFAWQTLMHRSMTLHTSPMQLTTIGHPQAGRLKVHWQ